MPESQQDDAQFMNQALLEAEKGLSHGELPIGAVMVSGGEIIARARARDREYRNRISHAELLLLQDPALKGISRKEMALYVNLEPCPMCIAAIVQEGLGRVVYGLSSKLDGGLFLLEDSEFLRRCGGPGPRVEGGILAPESRALFSRFLELPGLPPGMAAFAHDLLGHRGKGAPGSGCP